MDAILAIAREFGWQIAGIVSAAICLGGVIRYQNTRLEKATEQITNTLQESHKREVATLQESHLREIEGLRQYAQRGWDQAAQWQTEAMRLSTNAPEQAKMLSDMAGALLQRRSRSAR